MPVNEKLELRHSSSPRFPPRRNQAWNGSKRGVNDVKFDAVKQDAEDDQRPGGALLAHLPAAARDPVWAKRVEGGGHDVSHGI